MKKYSIVIFLLMCSYSGICQVSKWQVRAEYFQPKSLISFENATVNGFHFPKNYGIALGVERDLKVKKARRWYNSVTAGFYNDIYFERVVSIEANLGLSMYIKRGLNAGFEVGAGYNRGQSSHLISVFENNKWISKIDKSIVTNRFVPNASLFVGYDFSKHFLGVLPISVNASLGANVLLPFLPDLDYKIGVNTNRKITLKYRF